MFQKVVEDLVDKDWPLPAPSPLIIKMGIERLDKLFPNGVSDGRIIDFIVYQIYRFRDMIGVKDTRWNMTWCFSDNAVQKFKHQFLDASGKAGMLYYIDQWLEDGGLNRGMLEKMIKVQDKHRLAKLVYIQSEDCTKKRFLNTEMGLALCLQSTTGWSPQSPVCSSCTNSEKCKVITQKKYPELFRLRSEKL